MEIGERFDPLAGVTAQDAEDGSNEDALAKGTFVGLTSGCAAARNTETPCIHEASIFCDGFT